MSCVEKYSLDACCEQCDQLGSARYVQRNFSSPMAAAGSASGSHRVQPIDADIAKGLVTEQTARVENLAMSVIAQRSVLEKTALRELRARHPGITTDELVRVWIDKLTGRSPSDITDAVGDDIEEVATTTSNKVTSYLQLLAQNESDSKRDNCLDCTFCRAWFPDFWLLDLMPQGSSDWRRQYFRCCYQSASEKNDDLYWHPEHPTLSSALHRQPGTAVSIGRTDYEHHQRQPVANLEPKSWVIAIDDSNTNQKRLHIEALCVERRQDAVGPPPRGHQSRQPQGLQLVVGHRDLVQHLPEGPHHQAEGGHREISTTQCALGRSHQADRSGEPRGQQGRGEAATPCPHPSPGGPLHRRYPRDHRGAAGACDGSVPPVGRKHLEVGHRSKLGSTFLLRARLHG